MSTSLLCHAFGLPNGYLYRSTCYEYDEKQLNIVFVIDEKRSYKRCSQCDSRNIILRGKRTRRFRTVPIGWIPTWIEHDVHRIECKDCGCIRQEKVRLAAGSTRYTNRFKKLVLLLSRFMTIKDVANFLQVSWDFVKVIQKKHLHDRYHRPNIKKLKRIAIDEVYMGKKMGYLTLVLDLQHGEVVYVGEGKSGEALTPFWRRLDRAKVKLEVVATDMGSAFIKSARENQSQAVNVVDHFHVIKLYNEKLTKLRRDLQKDAETAQQKKVIKGTRWLLLANEENLAKKGESAKKKLDAALALNEPLAKAYYLKEELGMIWKQPDKAAAESALTAWILKAEATGITMIKSFGRTLTRLRRAILAYYDFDGLSSGPMEGTNNKVKTLQKMAYGFRDLDFLKLKILSMHESQKAAFS